MPKRIVVLVTSPKKSRVLVIGEKNFHALNTEQDWPIGKKRKAPRICARSMLYDALLAIPSKPYLENCFERRVVLPSGAHCYISSDAVLVECIQSSIRARKFLRLCECVHLHDIEKLKSPQAFELYSPITIEAVQTIFGNTSLDIK
jgi:hypothetical protein